MKSYDDLDNYSTWNLQLLLTNMQTSGKAKHRMSQGWHAH